ncbi:MAG: nitrogen regulation protein NR(II) [Sandaracinaceae bacterium]
MGADLYVVLIAGTAYFALAGLCFVRARRSPLALPMGLLSVVLSLYTSAEFLSNLARHPRWEWAEAASAAMAAPLLFHLMLAFVGARRAHRVALRVAYVYFGLIALSSLAPLFAPQWSNVPGGQAWSASMLVGVVAAFGAGLLLLLRHHQESGSPEERARTRLFGTAVAVGVGGPSTDLIAHTLGATPLPYAAALALLAAALLLAALALHLRLLRGTRTLLAMNAALIAAGGLAGTSLVAVYAGDPGRPVSMVLWGFALVIVGLLAAGAVRRARSVQREQERRAARLATLGRLSAQMAHDIRNPLAAVHGAAQILEEERRRGDAGLAPHEAMLSLILEQTERIEGVVRDYRRLGAAEAERAPVDVTDLLSRLAARSELAAGSLRVRSSLPSAFRAELDEELITTALENLVRNAMEADAQATVVLGAMRAGSALVLRVEDDGPGMDARTREQAVESFFTTKAEGSGLGLAFAARIAAAHGGRLDVRSALGRGTTVSMRLPLE